MRNEPTKERDLMKNREQKNKQFLRSVPKLIIKVIRGQCTQKTFSTRAERIRLKSDRIAKGHRGQNTQHRANNTLKVSARIA